MIAPPPQMIMITIDHINVYNAYHNINGNKIEASKPVVERNGFLVLSFLDMAIKVGTSCMACNLWTMSMDK